jgi:F420-dependent oxidoreductase-like protein
MKFGLFIPQGWRHDLVGIDPALHWGVMAGLAKRADDNEQWTSLWVFDHFHTLLEPTEEATHEAWSLMSAFAGITSRIRLGQMCTCMGYRNPAYLAKVATTVDIVSEGRIEMGIGAGWYEHEWEAYGYGFPGAGERLGMLREGVDIMRQMWTTGRGTLAGKHYQVDGALNYPLPLQGTSLPGSPSNGIPVWVAGGGERVTLKIAAKYADYTTWFGASVEAWSAKNEIFKGHCAALGRDDAEVVRSTNFDIVIGHDQKEIDDRLAGIRDRLERGGVSPAKVEERMHHYSTVPGCGTPEQVTERLAAFGAAGLGYAIANFAEAAYDTSGIETFEREVIPELETAAGEEDPHSAFWHLMHRR